MHAFFSVHPLFQSLRWALFLSFCYKRISSALMGKFYEWHHSYADFLIYNWGCDAYKVFHIRLVSLNNVHVLELCSFKDKCYAWRLWLCWEFQHWIGPTLHWSSGFPTRKITSAFTTSTIPNLRICHSCFASPPAIFSSRTLFLLWICITFSFASEFLLNSNAA